METLIFPTIPMSFYELLNKSLTYFYCSQIHLSEVQCVCPALFYRVMFRYFCQCVLCFPSGRTRSFFLLVPKNTWWLEQSPAPL